MEHVGESYLIYTLAFGMLLLMVCIAGAAILIYRVGKYISYIWKDNKKYKELMKNVDDMKAKGEFHDWIELAVGLENHHVCRKTGYCPKLDIFMSLDYIREVERQRKIREEYKEFEASELAKIAKEYNMTEDGLHQLVEQLFNIKKNFHIQYTAKNNPRPAKQGSNE